MANLTTSIMKFIVVIGMALCVPILAVAGWIVLKAGIHRPIGMLLLFLAAATAVCAFNTFTILVPRRA